MKSATPRLFSPGRIANVALANRAIVSPMTRTSATVDGLVTPAMVDYYEAYARGGWGLVMVEATYMDKRYSQGYNDQPGIADDVQRDAWRPLVDACHRAGTPIFLQLIHGGAVNQGNRWIEGAIAPSVVQPKGEQIDRYNGKGPFQLPREITREEMRQVALDFGRAAKRAAEIGFDGV
ncbi:MAG: NADH:flavin oxidoreductase, partial [Burkholderiales bacterium]